MQIRINRGEKWLNLPKGYVYIYIIDRSIDSLIKKPTWNLQPLRCSFISINLKIPLATRYFQLPYKKWHEVLGFPGMHFDVSISADSSS